MDYKDLYEQLIQLRKTEQLVKSKEQAGMIESHHILPRCCGGTDDPNNIVNLYAKEHFMAHYYLWKMHENDEFKYPLLNAFWMMCTMGSQSQEKTYQEFVKMSEEYQEARIQFAKHLSTIMPEKVKGNRNGMSNFRWIRNRTTKESKVWPKDQQIPDGWEYGSFLKKTQKVQNSIAKFSQANKGKRQIYNSQTNELKYIEKNQPIQPGFSLGGKPLSDKAKEKLHNYNVKYNAEIITPKRIKELRPMYKYYCQHGWISFQKKYKYTYTQTNFLQLCKRYLPEYGSY